MLRKTILITISLFCLLQNSVLAGVNHRNGNFYISYTDIVNNELTVTRTYNSKSTYNGIFGLGWNTKYETFLVIGPAGTPVIYQHGGGGKQFYKPISNKENYDKQLQKSITLLESALVKQRIIDKGIEDQALISKEKDAIKRILSNQERRQLEWEKILENGKVDPIEVPIGTTFQYTCNCTFTKHKLERTTNGYTYTSGAGSLHFDSMGRLLRLVSNKGIEVQVIRTDKSRNSKIAFLRTDETEFRFDYNERGKAEKITDVESGIEAVFTYNGDRLIYSKDAGGNEHNFDYDPAFNMTRIGYSDGREKIMSYHPKTYYIAEIREPDGSVRKYDYGPLKDGDPTLNYYTEVRYYDPKKNGGAVTREFLEYSHIRLPSGARKIVSGAAESDGIRTEYEYNDDGVITTIKETSAFTKLTTVTNFTFDNNGRVKTINSGNWSRFHTYLDNASERLTEVVTSVGNVEKRKYKFLYDDNNRLIESIRGNSKVEISYVPNEPTVQLIKNGDDEIHFIRDQEGKIIRLSYIVGELNRDIEVGYDADDRLILRASSPEDAFLVSSVLSGMINAVAPSKSPLPLNKSK